MRGLTPNSYTFFFFLFIVLALFVHVLSINTLSSSETLTISSNRTIVSLGDVFELGFLKTADCWYLGIWYKNVYERTYVWVANRDNPLSNSFGTLKISSYNNLVLVDHSDTPVWSTNLTTAVKSSSVVAELVDNGNLVLKDSKTNKFLWQSFDFPGDTLLPEMKLGWNLKIGYNRFLRSWKSPTDPSSGDLTFKLDTGGLPEFYVWKNELVVYRTGPWNGIRSSGIPNMEYWRSYVVSNFKENREEIAYGFKSTNQTYQSFHSRLTLSDSGSLQMFAWIPSLLEWNIIGILPENECDLYSRCGSYSYCDQKTSPVCKCIRGFVPKNKTAWAVEEDFDGCVRKSRLSCGGRDGFLLLKNMKLPETSKVIVDRRIGLKECKERCLQDCNCTGFANTDIRNGGSGCAMWTDELVDMRNYAEGGQDLYVKLAAADLS